MAELMLVNPRARRRRRKNPTGKRRSAVRAKRRKNPVRHRVHARRRHNPIHLTHRRKRYRRNPIDIKNTVKDTLVPAGIAALGALGLDVIWGYIGPMLPSGFGDTSSITGVLAKGAGAIGVGMLAGKAMGAKNGQLVALGGLTVVLHQLLHDKLAATFPTLTLGDMGYYNPSPVGQGMLGYYPPMPQPAPVGMAGMGVYDSSNIY